MKKSYSGKYFKVLKIENVKMKILKVYFQGKRRGSEGTNGRKSEKAKGYIASRKSTTSYNVNQKDSS